ncbi:MAG: undecaprenyl-diphosphate phosphatase [Bacteroidales bacterium]|jgi:undecaprenyl-diphosphatase|nr:MAG: undecaprenyl-diphosphate phosphatase [Paludibacter sp.]MCE1156467.1 undecaprenyl-diphosphate phosphatase [Bacteroidales bacterium]ODT55400.1 MAG: UDP-diphosphatase [Paludibacter sp. SCN 50-10]ODU61194.1 MAG: UDP-diphosphatase [Paludibacter sp. SCN 51-9]OJX91696.1 MAG: UDP-diphosphatase [Paludibacter sp. 47-17]
MSLFETIIIAIVEGLTEFLPVSSTGHMIITQSLLGMESSDFVKAFTVNIQFGAILSVVVLYWKRFFQSMKFYRNLLVAFLPAAFIGFLAGDFIDSLLENVWVVAVMLVLGGIVMLFVDKWFANEHPDQEMNWKRALKIGFFQTIAMIPGVSRSMATIVGGMSSGLSRKNAAEFSFFLAVPTMAAAGGYKLLQLFLEPEGAAMLGDNLTTLLIGNLVAFIVAMAAIKFFIRFLTKYGFKAFGYYRIIVGILILVLLLTGSDLSVG